MKRHDPFRHLFDEVADIASILSNNLIVSYDGKRIFPSATPHSIGIWSEAELEACDKITYECIRANHQRSPSVALPQDQGIDERSPSGTRSPSLAAELSDSDGGTESASGGDTFRLTLRSGKTKDIVLTVRSTTKCGAIVKAFLKKAGLADQYAGANAPAGGKGKGRGKKTRGVNNAGAGPMLMLDGDKMAPETEIGEADLEDALSLRTNGSHSAYSEMVVIANTEPLSLDTVPLRTGPPTATSCSCTTRAKFTWTQLKTFVNSGDLGLLKRDRKLQVRYDAWAKGIKAEHGSVVNYLLNYRLRWGEPDTLSLLRSALYEPSNGSATSGARPNSAQMSSDSDRTDSNAFGLPDIPEGSPLYFTADTPPELISIIMNDWPTPEIEHALIWTRLPIFPPTLPDPSESPLSARLHQDGLWGFTGTSSPPPSPSTLPACLPALAEWGVTPDKLVRSPRPTEEEEREIRAYGRDIDEFVKRRWVEREWETAWFVNPPVSRAKRLGCIGC
ncbi:N-acetylglucosamine-induced protein 1 [Grifola frondosa]|uniref:N-acetylglucosamine-induced protein 1 n=1 Tax=Grifola frondosa TaxID=5627 RepID=A0A1C7LXU6_GRIFR|nr:N-acetylglucosamine-induced protein 1 [Grifola frondosa]